jgi:hypothetical protein
MKPQNPENLSPSLLKANWVYKTPSRTTITPEQKSLEDV